MTHVSDNKNILLVAYINSHLPELFRLVKLLKETDRFEPTLCFSLGHDTMKDEWVELFRKHDVRTIDQYGRLIYSSDSVDGKAGAIRTTKHIIASAAQFKTFKRLTDWLYRTGQSLISETTLKNQQSAIEHLLRVNNINLIVLCEDNAAYATGLMTVTGHRLGIPSVIVPYTIANATEAAEHAYDQRRHWVRWPLQRSVAKKYPQWVHRHKGQPLLLLSPQEIEAQEKLHLAPPDPWMINSGFADAIAAESPFMVNYYLKNQIPKEKIVLTGTFTDDLLKAGTDERIRRRAELDREYGLQAQLPVLLCAFPPPWFPRPACDFHTYHQLIDFWLGALKDLQHHNVLINLHPGIGNADRQYIADHGLSVSSWDISRLIPAADLYVANISATIRWAIACGLPVLNYDVYKYRFHDYDSAPSVITVESKKDFIEQLSRLTNNTEYYLQMKQKQERARATWGMLDGQSGRRMIQLFDRLIDQGPTPQ